MYRTPTGPANFPWHWSHRRKTLAKNAEEQARKIEEIMVHSMEEVMGQGIPAASEYVVADCWTKS
jgi:hypothetical protein